ncbi:hypothetical protein CHINAEXTREME_12330 [Halobiforma lacisalsi AJ5]|uniref:DUF192 domain-containing protein n=2 Tax=Natronobacterium TaxID=2256 RepID=M0LHF3_NATLA|nr:MULTISPECIES: DUF192 domain-containing protein [Halobiforma]APW98512.1 hypothetical protein CHINAEXTREME_12330 [Halobiforma lacisalsi AJ5]EMA33037.1 hypothetical protein C445_09625 [Halobiforma lacisalsi AJ5]SFC62531.1 hypothetical protein SAMN05444422_11272 [Halobiforma haloterrestris]
MRVRHEPADGEPTTLASTVDLADSIVSQTRGLMFRRSLPDDYALAFRFDAAKTRDVHMLFVFVPLDVVWLVDGVVERVERLRPWRGFERARADTILELPAGTAAGVDPGDRVVLEGE